MNEMQVNLEFEVFDFYRSILMPLNYELTQPDLYYEINFSITIQHRLIVLGLIPLTSYSWSAEFLFMLWLVSHTLSPDIYFLFMVN
jgi:hypothetical protein